MKRQHEGDGFEEEPAASMARREEGAPSEETHILQDLQTDLLQGDLNSSIEKRLFETQKQYFTVYMEKLMQKIPMGEDLVKIIQNRGSSNEFEYMFTAAKSVIHSQMRVKQIKAFHAVFDMVYSLMWRYVHEKVVSPTMSHILTDEQLKLAYEKYQCCSQAEENDTVIEMQCLLYCIQEMLEHQEPVKIPNPLYSRFTQQMKAMSEYVITLLVALAKPAHLVGGNPLHPLGKEGSSGWHRKTPAGPPPSDVDRNAESRASQGFNQNKQSQTDSRKEKWNDLNDPEKQNRTGERKEGAFNITEGKTYPVENESEKDKKNPSTLDEERGKNRHASDGKEKQSDEKMEKDKWVGKEKMEKDPFSSDEKIDPFLRKENVEQSTFIGMEKMEKDTFEEIIEKDSLDEKSETDSFLFDEKNEKDSFLFDEKNEKDSFEEKIEKDSFEEKIENDTLICYRERKKDFEKSEIDFHDGIYYVTEPNNSYKKDEKNYNTKNEKNSKSKKYKQKWK